MATSLTAAPMRMDLMRPRVTAEIDRAFAGRPCRVLEVGCGAGLLSNALAARGHRVVGLDPANDRLAVAASHDVTRAVEYVRGDALALPWPADTFDVVCAMDLLERVEQPARVVAQVARVLAPGGRFFYRRHDELVHLCRANGLTIDELTFTPSLRLGYIGVATKAS